MLSGSIAARASITTPARSLPKDASNMNSNIFGRGIRFTGVAAVAAMAALAPAAAAGAGSDGSVNIQVFTPKSGDLSGVGGRAILVDLKAEFDTPLADTGASPELTGPAAHNNTAPLPGSFGDGANADHFPGLVVLLSSTRNAAGPGQNHANAFNITTITDRRSDKTEVWSTWIVGAPNTIGIQGQNVPSRLFVAVVKGTAPDVVQDMDGNGVFDEKDLALMGFEIISSVVKRDFVVNGF